MARTTTPLNDTLIKKSKPKEKLYRLFDGNGLFLEIKPNGKKVFRVDYYLNKKRKTYTIGEYPSISLANARKIAKEVRNKAKDGTDPVKERKHQQYKINLKIYTVQSVITEFFNKKESEWNSTYYLKLLRRVDIYINPFIVDKNITQVTKQDLIQLIEQVPIIKTPTTKQTNKADVTRRVFQLLNQIFRYAYQKDYIQYNPLIGLDISELTPKLNRTKLNAILEPKELRILYKAISEYPGSITTQLALRFLALTALRPGNIRNLKWEYIDEKKRYIIYPGSAMKAKKEFRLPLTDTLLSIIEEMKQYTYKQSDYVFCSPLSFTRQMSDNTLNFAHKRIGFDNHTSHGWRSAFSTNAYENLDEHKCSTEAIEAQLAHTLGSSVKTAYLRSDFLEERYKLLQWWEEFLNR